MYYQLTIQFGTDEIENAKKVLELASELDVKHTEVEAPETFAWEQEQKEKPEVIREPETKEEPVGDLWVPQETASAEDVPKPEPEKPKIMIEDLQKAGVDFAKEKGVSVLKALLTQMGVSKICDIPEEKYQEAWEALHA